MSQNHHQTILVAAKAMDIPEKEKIQERVDGARRERVYYRRSIPLVFWPITHAVGPSLAFENFLVPP
jgi:hypothetical protein